MPGQHACRPQWSYCCGYVPSPAVLAIRLLFGQKVVYYDEMLGKFWLNRVTHFCSQKFQLMSVEFVLNLPMNDQNFFQSNLHYNKSAIGIFIGYVAPLALTSAGALAPAPVKVHDHGCLVG